MSLSNTGDRLGNEGDKRNEALYLPLLQLCCSVQISRGHLESDDNSNQSSFFGGLMVAACNTLLVSSRLIASCHYTRNSSEGFFV